MFGIALTLYLLFILGYGAFLWAILWHLWAYRLPASPAGGPEGGAERVSTALITLISILLFVSFLLFFQIPWQSYSLLPIFPL